ncbi:THO complex subunit 3, partial [Rhizoclosmatium hyalinum]
TKELSKGQVRDLRTGHRSKILSVAWSASGTKLASGSYDHTAKVFSLGECALANIRDAVGVDLKGHSADVDQVKWHPTDDFGLATTSADKTVKVWDVRAPAKPSATVQTTGENINIAWSPDGNTIAVGNKDDIITFIDTRTSSVIHTLPPSPYEINEIRWSHSGSLFFMTLGNGTIQVLNPLSSYTPLTSLNAHTSNCYCIEFDPLGRYFAVGSSDSLVTLWDLDELICLRTIGHLDMPIRSLSFSYCGDLIACSTMDDKVIEIAAVESGESLYSLQVGSTVDQLAWHPSKYIMAYVGDDVTGKSSGSNSRSGSAAAGNGSVIGIYTLH